MDKKVIHQVQDSFEKLKVHKQQFFNEIIEFKHKQDDYEFSIIYYGGHAIQDDNGNSYIMGNS